MGRFQGKNKLNSGELFYERMHYSHEAFEREFGSLYVKPVADFYFAERALYGRINKNHNPIILNKANTKNIGNKADSVQTLSAVNFVVDAFEALAADFNKAVFNGKLDLQDPHLSELTAYGAYQDVDTLYTRYLDGLEAVFRESFLDGARNRRIRDFKSFLPVFFEFIKQVSSTGGVTMVAFIASNFCNSTISGLTISVSELDPTDDSKKEEFLTSPNFDYYRELLKSHGFYINKHRPWELVADIASPFMLQYANAYGLSTENDVLKRYYHRAGGAGVTLLKRLALRFYNGVVVRRKFVTVRQNGVTKRICRRVTNLETVDRTYSQNFWLDKYTDIRYAEQREPISPGELISLKKDQAGLFATKGLKYTLSHINNKLNGFANYEGSFAKIRLRRQSQLENRPLKPTY